MFLTKGKGEAERMSPYTEHDAVSYSSLQNSTAGMDFGECLCIYYPSHIHLLTGVQPAYCVHMHDSNPGSQPEFDPAPELG